jgi:hypothetical protein
MACPHVAGLAGLVISQNPTFTNDQVMNQIKHTADDINSAEYPGEDNYLGFGRINAYQALTTSPHPVISFKGYTIDDTSGNNNGRADPGETVNMTVTLKNSWVNATGVTATLSTTDPYVNITAASSSFGDIAAGSTANNSANPYTFSVTSDCPQGHKATFALAITAQGYSNIHNFSLILGQPSILLVDDDYYTGCDLFFKEALDANGLTYDVWEVAIQYNPPYYVPSDIVPTAEQMAPYDTVVWTCGNLDIPAVSYEAQSELATYLDGGGNLFLSAYTYLTYDAGAPDSPTPFTVNYLGIPSYVDLADTYWYGPGAVYGTTGDPITDAMYLMLSYRHDPSFTRPFNSATPIFTGEYSYTWASRYADPTNTFKTVFFGFPFERITTAAERKYVMNRITDWFRGTSTSQNCPPTAYAQASAYSVWDNDNNGIEDITLDASYSYDPDGGTIVSYEWKEAETVLSNAASFTGSFTIGVSL